MTKSKSGAATSRCCDAFALQIQIRRTYLARTHAVDQQLHNSMASDIRHFQFFIPACKNAMNEKNRNGIFFCIVLPVQHEQMDSDSLSTNQMERMTAFKGTEHKIQPTLTYTKKKENAENATWHYSSNGLIVLTLVPNEWSANGKRLKKVGGAGSPRCAIFPSSCRKLPTTLVQRWFLSTSIAVNAIRSYPLEMKIIKINWNHSQKSFSSIQFLEESRSDSRCDWTYSVIYFTTIDDGVTVELPGSA